ncbi:carboxypeptidase-like protein [Mucilaginibacter yixingensis]|uniref:Carboxypeptidase-like protein n=2 Tax=Mucilaginibacter yixingensis TaxID=1295612 RepID=A0A2T5J805_9SPHI|nr:carboxypeptidase-like protein [Mucilaginibacter yixingensis]
MRVRACHSVNRLGILFPIWCVICVCVMTVSSAAQSVKNISGKITDSETGEPLPYVTVFVKVPGHSHKAASTDFSGIYHLAAPAAAGDSIFATYVGYKTTQKLLPKANPATVDFQLASDNKMLAQVNITPKSYVNPAWEIMANVVKHKAENDPDKLKSYQYESYSRLELSVTNISDKMKKRKLMRQILPLMDSLQKIAGEDGTPVLPVFMSETVSDYYHQTNPDQKAEVVKRTKMSGVGIEDETLISQIVGSSLQQYNFYRNYIRLANKDFMSPITDSWKMLYNYDLAERDVKIDGKDYYRLEFKPKRSHDLSFVGTMWISHDNYALYRMDVSVTPDANLDFLNKIRIQEQMTQPEGTSSWLPEKTRITVHVSNINPKWSGFLGKFYISNKNIVVNKIYPPEVFKEPLTMANDVTNKDESYWTTNRPEPLTDVDKKVYKMIDTVKNLPIVRTYADIAAMLINGYYRPGNSKFSFGPYLYTYSYNDVQGSVLRLGGISNRYFSENLILGGYVAYGFRDRKWNFNGSVDYIFSRKPWTEAGISFTRDLGQTGYQFENFSKSNNIFKASIRNGNLLRRGPFQQNELRAYVQTDVAPNLTAKLTTDRRTFDPLYNFDYISPIDGLHYRNYQVAEAITELQWQPGRRLLQSAQVNKRIALGGGTDNPVITIRYTHGFKGVTGGDFDYDKIAANITQKIHMGIFGKGEYSLTGGYIPSSLPSPMLENHRYNFNTMRFLEYVSDRYVALNYTQHMEGLITNSIPLLRSLNVRTVADLNVLDGSLSDANGGRPSNRRPTRNLEGTPYVELGYGLENIFKFLRVDFLHRVTHRDHVDEAGVPPSNFATRVTLQFRL